MPGPAHRPDMRMDLRAQSWELQEAALVAFVASDDFAAAAGRAYGDLAAVAEAPALAEGSVR